MRRFKRKIAQILSGVGAGIITATTIVPGMAGATETDNLFAHVGETLEVESGDKQEYVIGEDKVELETKSINKEDVYAVSFTEKTPVIEEKNISIEDGEVVSEAEEEDDKELALISKGDGLIDAEEETTIAAAIKKLEAESEEVSYADVQSIVWTVETDEKVFPVNTINTEALEKVYASIEDGSVLDSITGMDITSIGAASDKNDYVIFYYMPQVTEVQEETTPAVKTEATTEVSTEAETEATTVVEVDSEKTEGKIAQDIVTSIESAKEKAEVVQEAIDNSGTIAISSKDTVATEKIDETFDKIEKVKEEAEATKFYLRHSNLIVTQDAPDTIDEVWVKEVGLKDDSIIYTQTNSAIPIVKENGAYVAYLTFDLNRSEKPTDVAVALNDDTGSVVTDVKQEWTGDNILKVTIPSKYFESEVRNKEGDLLPYASEPIRIQTLVKYLHEDDMTSEVSVNIDNQSSFNIRDVSSIKVNDFDLSVSIPLADKNEDIDSTNVEAYINGNKSDIVAMDIASFDKETGALTITHPVYDIQTIDILVKDDVKSENVQKVAIDDNTEVIATYDNEAFDGEVTFNAKLLDDTALYEKAYDIANKQYENLQNPDIMLIDMNFTREGKEVEPKTDVDIKLVQKDKDGSQYSAGVIHFFDDSETYELRSVEDVGNVSEYTLSSFSASAWIRADGMIENPKGEVTTFKYAGKLPNFDASKFEVGQIITGNTQMTYGDYNYPGFSEFVARENIDLGDGNDDDTIDFMNAKIWGDKSLDNLHVDDTFSGSGSLNFVAYLNPDSFEGMFKGMTAEFSKPESWASAQNVALACAHVTRTLGLDRHNVNMNENETLQDGIMKVRIIQINTEAQRPYVILGFATQAINTQSGTGIMKFEINKPGPKEGYIRVQKHSTAQAAVDGGANGEKYIGYSLEHAKFAVYNNEACTGDPVGTLETGSDSFTGPLKVPVGTYWVVETGEPAGHIKSNEKVKVDVAAREKPFEGTDHNVDFTNEIKRVNFRLQKKSGNKEVTDGNSEYSLEGAKFGLYNSKAKAEADTNNEGKDALMILTTDATGLTDVYEGMWNGTYYVKELKAPKGYKLDTAIKEFSTDFQNEYIMPWEEFPNTTTLTLKKTSSSPDVTNGNSEYSLAGAEFGVYSDEACKNSIGTFTTDANGNATKNITGLAIGKTVYVKETKAPKGFKIDTKVQSIKLAEGTNTVTFTDEPTLTTLDLKKVSANPEITNGNDCYTLAGGEFGVYKTKADANQDKNRVGTLTTKADGTTNKLSGLPMSTYFVKEVKAPKGYVLNTEVKEVKVDANGATVTMANEPGKDPTPISLKKVDDSGSLMPNVAMSGAEFEFKYYPNSKWEGEPLKEYTKTIVTDANGIADLAKAIPDGYPAGTYTVQEKKAPQGYKLDSTIYKGVIEVLEDGTVDMKPVLEGKSTVNAKDDKVFEIKNIRNPEVSTSATDKNTGVRSGVTGNTTITDTVTYKNLYENKKYTMKGTLMDKETGKPLTINGKTFVVEKEFEPSAPNGTVSLDFNVPTTSLAGKSTVVFEELIPTEGRPGATHTDINDKKQEVKFPSVGTKAIDKNSGIQAGVNGKTTYVDTVSYTNLDVGSKYKVTGILMDKETGKELTIGGKTVTASATFEPKEENGTVKVEFNLDATSLKGKSVVVFEKLFIVKKDGTEVEVGRHENINDGGQEIATSRVITSAEDFQTKNHTAVVGKTILHDTVKYSNLIPNKTYTISGTLMDKETGKPIQVDGKDVKSKPTTFTPKERNGSVVIEFEVDTTTLEGKKTVVFEDLFYEGVKLTSHADINDKEQSIDIPKIRTTAVDGQTKNHTGVTGVTTIVDTVKYTNLTVDQEYIMEGIVMDKATGKELKVDGKTVTATQKFTPKTQDGTVDVTFKIDASELKGKDVVVFETLYQGKLKITEHKSINDKGQTINFAEVRTRAINEETQNQTNTAVGETTIMDTVSYKNLTVGQEYFLEGKLVDKATGEYIKDANGQEITSGKIPFTPDKPTGQTQIPIKVDTSVLKGKKIVVFEKLYQGDVEVTAHEDINDIPQNTEVPTLGTTATDIQTGNHTGVAGVSTIVDEVKYTGLTIGQKYIVKGVLMDKTTGEPVVIDGKEIISEQEFVVGEEIEYTHPSMTETTDETEKTDDTKTDETDKTDDTKVEDTKADDTKTEDTKTEDAKVEDTKDTETEDTKEAEDVYEPIEGVTSDGMVKLFYDLDAKDLKGHQVVVFETLYQIPNDVEETTEKPEKPSEEKTETPEPVKVISHEDIEDEGQTVDIPDAQTTATDKNTTTHTAVVGKTTIVDEVRFTGLTIGETYTFKGKLVDKETGEPLMQNGEEVTAEATLEAQTKDGSQLLEFEVDTEVIAGRSVVAEEEVWYKDVMITDHKDLTDEDQTVNVPTIATTATGQNGKTVEYGSSVTIVDTVTYTNLTVGENYTMSGTMVDQNGNAVSNVESVPFTAQSANGSVEVKFVIDTTAHAGQKLVAFEELTAENGTKITEHKDLTDEGQTVYVDVPPEVPYTPTPPTGNKSNVGIVAGIAGGAAVAAAALALGKKRKREE